MTETPSTSELEDLWNELTQADELLLKRIREQQFAERAAQFARPKNEEQVYAPQQVYQVLTFRAGDEHYGVDVKVVRGVRALDHISRVPGVPAFYTGIINVRGQIVSVLDLRIFLGLEPSASDQHEVILINGNDLTIALLADQVESVMAVPRDSVEAVDMRYAKGVTADRLIIVNIDNLLTDQRLIIGGEK